MKYLIMHESMHSMRISFPGKAMSLRQADILEYYLKDLQGVQKVTVYDRTGDVVIVFDQENRCRERLVDALCNFSYEDEHALSLVPDQTSRELDRKYEEQMLLKVLGKGVRSLFLPAPIQTIWTVLHSLKYVWKGIQCLATGHLDVPVLDATAITASIVRGDCKTAASVMFLLELGELLEEWTHRKSVSDLASAMSLRVEQVWLKTEAEDVLADIRTIKKGDIIIVGTSSVIPLDGRIVEGEVSVNQSSMTGESVPVLKKAGGLVYAGTVVEEGQCLIEVTSPAGSGKYDQIIRMIEESEKLKSATEEKAYHLADRLVPYALGGTALTYLLTRNMTRAISFLMVDFSCALKLSMPLSVLSAIKEAGDHGATVKGGKYMEALANADTIVFDKTGTLTHASPTVAQIVTFDGMVEDECLRIAACLEEHYPHSIANAVVAEAAKRGILHEEKHSKVEYVVAHGISSSIDGIKAIIGSYHFVFEDENCVLQDHDRDKLEQLPSEYSHLYLAMDGRLKAVICIEDPLREEAAEVIQELHGCGISKICMMTGDNERTAAAIAGALDLDEYHSEVLPEDKAAFIRQEHEAGRTVIMIGDGVNDTPALSEADVGIAICDGAAIAREIADITIRVDSLYPLLALRKISQALMNRIDSNYRFIMTFNSLLIAAGVTGWMPPSTSALLHNSSTVITGLRSLKQYDID